MSFSPGLRALANGKICIKISLPRMSVSTEKTAGTPASRNPERTEEATNGISPELIEERIKANLGPLNEQISALTQLLNQLIKESSGRNSPTADTRTQQTQSRLSSSREAGTSGAPQTRGTLCTGSPLDNHCALFFWTSTVLHSSSKKGILVSYLHGVKMQRASMNMISSF